MRKYLFTASIAAAALVPSIASARTQSEANCEQQGTTQVVATVAGAGVGGVLGNVVAGQGDKTLGTVLGAAAGALAGNQLAKPNRECNHAYGYYDQGNRWHATAVSAADARGYYDRNGGWVDGQPNGRYGEDNRWIGNNGSARGYGDYRASGEWVPASADGYYDRNDQWVRVSDNGRYGDRRDGHGDAQPTRRADAYGYYDTQAQWHAIPVSGRATGYYDRNNTWVAGAPNGYYDGRRNWVPQRADGSASGSYDSQNRWVPASSNGYYDEHGQWVAGTASGHYDASGRWTPGVTIGHYDARGRWVADQAGGRRDASGMWIADPQPGHYDSRGRWHAGETAGYYDSHGGWIATGTANGGTYATGRPTIRSQLTALDRYAVTAQSQRSMSDRDVASFQREVYSIRTSEQRMRHDRRGHLSARDQARLQTRIDRLHDRMQINAE